MAAVEDGLVGGECPYWGCVPSKMMIRAADLLAEGRQVPGIVSQLLGRPHHRAEYHAVPRVTFTDPEIGAVGMTEAQARDRLGDAVQTALVELPDSARGWIYKADNRGVIKLIADSERGVLVGATSAGPMGGEVLSMLTLAVHAPVPVSRLREMIYAYPTFHRAVEDALQQFG